MEGWVRKLNVRFKSETGRDRKSTRLNSSHDQISYAVFCLKKKKKTQNKSEEQLSYLNICLTRNKSYRNDKNKMLTHAMIEVQSIHNIKRYMRHRYENIERR